MSHLAVLYVNNCNFFLSKCALNSFSTHNVWRCNCETLPFGLICPDSIIVLFEGVPALLQQDACSHDIVAASGCLSNLIWTVSTFVRQEPTAGKFTVNSSWGPLNGHIYGLWTTWPTVVHTPVNLPLGDVTNTFLQFSCFPVDICDLIWPKKDV